jgi:hypothetical protein
VMIGMPDGSTPLTVGVKGGSSRIGTP